MPREFQSACAACAAATAAPTSAGPALSNSPNTSPVAGFTDASRETTNSALVAIWEEVYAGQTAAPCLFIHLGPRKTMTWNPERVVILITLGCHPERSEGSAVPTTPQRAARIRPQYSTLTRYKPLAGAVGPAAVRSRASRIRRKSSRLTVPFPISRNVRPDSAPCCEENHSPEPYISAPHPRASNRTRKWFGRSWCDDWSLGMFESHRLRHFHRPFSPPVPDRPPQTN